MGLLDKMFEKSRVWTRSMRYTDAMMKAQWTTAQPIGSALNITGASYPSIVALNDTDLAVIELGSDELRTYQFNGATWGQIGSGLAINTMTRTGMARLNNTDIAAAVYNSNQLRTYRFNGSSWTQVGTSLNININHTLAALSSTDVAVVFSDASEKLRTYRFDGSSWSQVGSELTISNATYPAYPSLAALNSTDVAVVFVDGNNDLRLRTYQLSGSSWSQVGSELVILADSVVDYPAMTAINGTDVALFNTHSNKLKIYRFNGSEWLQKGAEVSVVAGYAALSALNGTDVAFLGNNELKTYRFGFCFNNPHRP